MSAATLRDAVEETRATSRTAGLMDGLRSMPLFRQLVPMESMINWPLPKRQRPAWDGRTAVYLTFLLSGFRRPARRGDPTELLPPFATLTLNWANGAPVEYSDLRYRRPWPITDPPPVVGGSHTRPSAASAWASTWPPALRLGELYDGLVENLLSGSGWAGDQEFAALFSRIVEPGLVPYYRAIAPEVRRPLRWRRRRAAMSSPDTFEHLRDQALALFPDTLATARRRGAEVAASRLAAAQERLRDSALTVVVCGEFKRGKSSLLNALLEEKPPPSPRTRPWPPALSPSSRTGRPSRSWWA